jgi:hypothetical protein
MVCPLALFDNLVASLLITLYFSQRKTGEIGARVPRDQGARSLDRPFEVG